ncbi:MAG: polysaccharide biosynthesis tyrosine autokinase [Flavobacteriales bacterium]|nr:polysaccharide biosynthesis tyrosine autokinase [Flavobacteriales bacterium]
METQNTQLPSEQQFQTNDFNVKVLLFSYLKYWYLFILSIGFALGAVYYINWYATPIYSTFGTVLINIERNNTDDVLNEIEGFSSGKQNLENEMQILKSRSLATRAIEELDFNVSYFLVGDIKISEIYDLSPFSVEYTSLEYEAYVNTFDLDIINNLEYKISYTSKTDGTLIEIMNKFGEKITTSFGVLVVSKTEKFLIDYSNSENTEYRKYKFTFHDNNDLAAKYLSQLSVDLMSKSSSILKISIRDQVSKKGADFINKLVEVYISSDIEEKNKLATNSLKFIDAQLNEIQANLRSIEFEKELYKSERGITDISTESSIILEAVKNIDVKISAYSIQKEYTNYLIDYLSENSDIGHIVPSSLGLEDQILMQLIETLVKKEQEREQVRIVSKKNGIGYTKIQDEIQELRKQILVNVNNINATLSIAIIELTRQLNKYESQIRSLPLAERELLGIQRQFTIKEDLYVYLLEKQAETAIVIASAISDNSVIDKAPVTYSPVSPVKEKNYAISLLLGIFLPIFLIYIKQMLNDTVNTLETIQQSSSIPLLGVITFSKSKNSLVVHEKPKSAISEAFRSLRTNLKYIGTEGNQKTILITSSISGEGKTFSCLNLSTVYAAAGFKTILVGLDLRKQKIAQEFNISNDIGVSTYLAGDKSFDEIIHNSGFYENLDIITAGPIPPNPSELIMTQQMDNLMEYLQSKYDKIIIDSPPIGLVTDGLLLTKYSNVNIIVVRQNVTKHSYLKNLQELYTYKRIPNMTLLFNAVNTTSQGYSYKYGYGYGYGYGYYEEEEGSGWSSKLKKKLGL